MIWDAICGKPLTNLKSHELYKCPNDIAKTHNNNNRLTCNYV